MASLQSIFKSPHYFGEISLEDTKNILQQEPPLSYLFRRLKNGTVTLATLFDFLSNDQLLEIEIKDCDCDGAFQNVQSSKNLERFIENCNFVFNPFKGTKKFNLPVTRNTPITHNPQSLEDITKFFMANHFASSIDQLNIPKKIKENLYQNHKHFELAIDENEASRRITIKNHAYDFFLFEIKNKIWELGIYQPQNLRWYKKSV